jgi:serine/threonine-protein kinase PknK
LNKPPSTGRPDLLGIPYRFEPLHLLGHGGGGAVWAARDRATGREVAIKLLHRGGGPAEADALIRETIALSGLEGLGLPRLLRLGRTRDGRPFLIRELIAGEGLDSVSVEQPARVPPLLCQVADALTVVHRAGLLHGDVKPANVIVRHGGGVSLVDLGLATALRQGSGLTAGLTPHFAAPEVRAGGELTPQGEVYALGVILADHIDDFPELFSVSVTDAMRQVAERATHPASERRFPSTDEFAQALRLALAGDAPLAEDPPAPWPVLGLEVTAHALEKAIAELAPGGTLYVVGPPGGGTSTLLRRIAFSAALGGAHVGYIDEVPDQEGFEDEANRAAGGSGLLIVDRPEPITAEMLAIIAGSGARLVTVRTSPVQAEPGDAGASRSEAALGASFELPPLSLPVVRQLLSGALPGLPPNLVPLVAERTGARPSALRRFVEAARTVPLAGEADVDAILAGTAPSDGDPLALLESSLARGHFSVAARALAKVTLETAHAHWLAARYELAAGTALQALELTDRGLEKVDAADRLCRERLTTTRARALLGVARYEDALAELSCAESFVGETAVEALAYRGLGQTLLGQGAVSLETLELAVEGAHALGSLRMLALCLSCLATAQWRLGRSDEAVQSYQRSIEAATQVADAGMLASALINLAGLRKERGELAESIRALESALDAARRSGRRTSLYQALLNLGNADLYLGRLERARAFLVQMGDPMALPASFGAQLRGLWADLHARSGDVEQALVEYEACSRGWAGLGRGKDAAEALLEKVLLAAGRAVDTTAWSSFEVLNSDVERAREALDDAPTALLKLAEARVAALGGEGARAEELCGEALKLAESSGQKEWAWRALALEAELSQVSGKQTRAERLRGRAVEILEDIAARLAEDLRAVFWNDPRRAALRADGTRHSVRTNQPPTLRPRSLGGHTPVQPTKSSITHSGTDAISRLSQTPLERRLAKILAINGDLAAEVELPRLAEKIVAHAAELLGAERGFLLLGQAEDSLAICASRGGQGEEHEQFSRTIAGRVLSSGMPLISVDTERDGRLVGFESVHAKLITAVACVPIFSPQGASIGALYLETRSGVRPDFADELSTLQAFADQAAIALTSARLLRELREKSVALERRNQELSVVEERLRDILGKRTARLREVREALRVTRSQLGVHSSYAGLVGSSPAMRRIYQLIQRIKDTDVPVLICGESGTGKEVVARAIHQGSVRSERKLVAINCGAIPEPILESELFGHMKGAFTGADRDRKGLLREADGGVLFLDEIGETPLRMQASLLRVLQEGRVLPVGGNEEVPIDVRVIFATNRNLDEAVRQGLFREDLLYRIRVVELTLPPLRERREDVPLLVDHFLERFAVRFNQAKKSLSRDALQRLLSHPLPGNVRQLENALLNAWVLSDTDVIQAEDIDLPGSATRSTVPEGAPAPVPTRVDATKRSTLSEHQRTERSRMAEALEAAGWNRVRAAQILGMPRRTFYRRLKEYGLQP